MLTISVSSPDDFVVREGDPVTLDLAMTGTEGSVIYTFNVIDETTDASDHDGTIPGTSFVLFSPFEVTRTLPIEFGTLKDRIDEETETFSIQISLEGGVFESGNTTESFQVSILDDVQQHGTMKSDQFAGSSGEDLYNGYGGRDVIKGMGGDDFLRGGGGADRVVGGLGSDRLLGNAKKDNLLGKAGADILFGGKGADKLNGGKGRDILVGQGGDDVFKFSKGRDVIRDFDKKGDDVINLRKVASIEDFTDLVDNHLSFKSGHAFIEDANGNTLKINNTTMASLSADDFLF
ncbi:MAG: calcium-binding protein [Arenibacterium sp.]